MLQISAATTTAATTSASTTTATVTSATPRKKTSADQRKIDFHGPISKIFLPN